MPKLLILILTALALVSGAIAVTSVETAPVAACGGSSTC
jgi:hypothetical protein